MKHARTLVTVAAVAALGAGAFVPASAATAPKFAGGYKVTLQPDPTLEAALGACEGVNPDSVDSRDIKVPVAGKLKVVLDSADFTGRNLTDWDLYLLDPKTGAELGSSHGASSHEEATITLKAARTVTIVVCNLIGSEEGTVDYTVK